ncbi:hypothetical protein BIW11_14213 [Tropilaelaps mercedesae]|uniref:Uncharacterized protein n=1 Tax=Tropilaelaps mercedesae TaxID=418985 RepID=A0A1V9WYQ1_9ACAR|nr:hypothetical protein BIW11_14213 [Tropilaelaps mercedesae]
MFRRKDKDTTSAKELCTVPSDFRSEFSRVISQIHARNATQDDELVSTLGRLRRLEGPREMEIVCVKNAIRKSDPTSPGVGLYFGSILGYSTDPISQRRVDIGEGRSDFAEMKRRLEQNLSQSCRFKQHAKIERGDVKLASDALGSDSQSDSDSARGRSASSSGSCHSPGGSVCGSASDCETEQLEQQELDEFMLDKFAHECKISLSTASVLIKPTVIEIETPLKENMRDEEFIEAQNDIMAIDVDVKSRKEQATKRRFIKHDPKSRRRVEPVFSFSTDSQYSSDGSASAVKNPDHSECSASETSDASESRDTVILGGGDLQLGAEPVDRNSLSSRTVCRISASLSSRDERPEVRSPTPMTQSAEPVQSPASVQDNGEPTRAPSPVLRPRKSFKAIRASYDRQAAVEAELIEVLPSVRRLASKFHYEGEGIDWKNKYHSLTGRSLSKEFRQKQLQAKPSLPRTARFEDASAITLERRHVRPPQLINIREPAANELVQPLAPVLLPAPGQRTTRREIQTQTSDDTGRKKKKQRSKSDSRKGFFDREILARLSKFQQFI